MFENDVPFFQVVTQMVTINNKYKIVEAEDTHVGVDVYRTYEEAKKGFYDYVSTRTVAYPPNDNFVELVVIEEIYHEAEATLKSIFLERQ